MQDIIEQMLLVATHGCYERTVKCRNKLQKAQTVQVITKLVAKHGLPKFDRA